MGIAMQRHQREEGRMGHAGRQAGKHFHNRTGFSNGVTINITTMGRPERVEFGPLLHAAGSAPKFGGTNKSDSRWARNNNSRDVDNDDG